MVVKQGMKEIKYYKLLPIMTAENRRQQEIQDMDYRIAAFNIIKEDKLEMCFKKLFPDVVYKQEHLEKILLTITERTIHVIPNWNMDKQYMI